jgi:hypothetical protein
VGLYVQLGPWGFHFFEVHPSSAAVQSTPSAAQKTS